MFENIISVTDPRGWTYAKCEADDVWYTFHFEQYETKCHSILSGGIQITHRAFVFARVFTPQRIGASMNHCHLMRAETLLPFKAALVG